MRNIDTNVFLRFLVADREKPPKGLLDFFSKLQKGEIEVFCLDLVFFQAIFVLKSFYQVEREEIINKMLELLSFDGLYMKDKRTIERTLEMWRDHSGDIIDCCIAATMEKTGEKEIVSYDKKIERLGIKRIEPSSL